jgi:hypothetical protein
LADAAQGIAAYESGRFDWQWRLIPSAWRVPPREGNQKTGNQKGEAAV